MESPSSLFQTVHNHDVRTSDCFQSYITAFVIYRTKLYFKLGYIMLRYIVLCYIILRYIILRYIIT